MNWYRLAQIQPYLFSDEEMKETESYQYSDSVGDDLDDATDYNDIIRILYHHGMNFDDIQLANGEKILVVEGKEIKNKYNFRAEKPLYVIDNFSYPQMIEAQEWIDNIDERNLDEMIGLKETDPWDDIPFGHVVYHGTYKEKVTDILKNGLEPRNDSRGLSNRSMGSSIFTSADYETASYAYDEVFEINMGQMKSDGYMPPISGEHPLEESQKRSSLAHKIGFDNYISNEYSSEGYSEDTIAIYGHIPKKYIRLIEK